METQKIKVPWQYQLHTILTLRWIECNNYHHNLIVMREVFAVNSLKFKGVLVLVSFPKAPVWLNKKTKKKVFDLWELFALGIKTQMLDAQTQSPVNKTTYRYIILAVAASLLLKALKTLYKGREQPSLRHSKLPLSTKLATSTPLVLTLCHNLLTLANPGLTLHWNKQRILAEWAYPGIVLTGLFWGNFLAY